MDKNIDIASLLLKKHRHRIAVKNWPSFKSSWDSGNLNFVVGKNYGENKENESDDECNDVELHGGHDALLSPGYNAVLKQIWMLNSATKGCIDTT